MLLFYLLRWEAVLLANWWRNSEGCSAIVIVIWNVFRSSWGLRRGYGEWERNRVFVGSPGKSHSIMASKGSAAITLLTNAAVIRHAFNQCLPRLIAEIHQESLTCSLQRKAQRLLSPHYTTLQWLRERPFLYWGFRGENRVCWGQVRAWKLQRQDACGRTWRRCRYYCWFAGQCPVFGRKGGAGDPVIVIGTPVIDIYSSKWEEKYEQCLNLWFIYNANLLHSNKIHPLTVTFPRSYKKSQTSQSSISE